MDFISRSACLYTSYNTGYGVVAIKLPTLVALLLRALVALEFICRDLLVPFSELRHDPCPGVIIRYSSPWHRVILVWLRVHLLRR